MGNPEVPNDDYIPKKLKTVSLFSIFLLPLPTK